MLYSANSRTNPGGRPGAPAAARSSLRKLLATCTLMMALAAQSVYAAPETVNVNSADAVTLAAVLDGVGIKRAEAIVDYRSQHGDFVDVYDLANVKGIGDRTVELNEERIQLND